MLYGRGLKDINWTLFSESMEPNTCVIVGLSIVHWVPIWYSLMGFRTKRLWIGTDVFKLRFPYYRTEARFMNRFIDEHCFVSEDLQNEFLSYFPHAQISQKIYGSELLPYYKRFNILVYLPKAKTRGVDNDWLYGKDRIEMLKRWFPEVNWMILDGASVPANMIDELYLRSDLILRLNRHDGDARMILRAKELGIPYIWVKDEVVDLEDISQTIKSLMKEKKQGYLYAKDDMLLHG